MRKTNYLIKNKTDKHVEIATISFNKIRKTKLRIYIDYVITVQTMYKILRKLGEKKAMQWLFY